MGVNFGPGFLSGHANLLTNGGIGVISKQSMLYHQDIDNCISGSGITPSALESALAALGPALERMGRARADGSHALLNVPTRRDDLDAVMALAARYRECFDDVLILGTGGSSLGGETLVFLEANDHAPHIRFLENVDPLGFEAVLATCDLSRTGVIVISKSGATPETLSQFLAILPRFCKAVGEQALANCIAVITDPVSEPLSPLRRIANNLSLPVLDHDLEIGGRYAALTNVGLLPAAIVGLDPVRVREGAETVLASVFDGGDPTKSAPVIGAALAASLSQKGGISQAIMMPYLDRLHPFSFWFCQLWAESLGKDGKGMTPIAAHGTVDQHSQLQLWLDGPTDKFFTFILGTPKDTGPEIDISPAATPAGNDDLAYLSKRRLGDLLAAAQEATVGTLAAHGRPVRVIRVETIDESTLGALMMHFMIETILTAELFGVDPYTQPAVEEGKALTRKFLLNQANASTKGGDGP
jgi:glucose-6-phosphate isomerase